MSDLPHRGKTGEHSFANDDNEEEDEEIDETEYKSVKDAVLFAIEVSPSMLKRPPASSSKKADTNSPLLSALKCAFQFMQQRIISSPKDLIGVLLYGTEETKFYESDDDARGGWPFPHCYLLTDLDIPDADAVKALKDLVEDDGSPESEAIFKPSDSPVQMHTVLFCANQIFQQRAANFASRRLFIVTDNDDPPGKNKAFRDQATVRAKDLYDLGVLIELFPISSPDHEFDMDRFYNDIVYKSIPSDPDAITYNPSSVVDIDQKLKTGSVDGITLLSSLLSSVASKITPKRALFSSAPLELAPGLRISVKGYLLYKHQQPARSSYIWLEGETPKIVKGERQQLAEGDDEAREVSKSEIRRAYTFGGSQILFSDAELKELKNWGEPIIKVVGFKPMKYLPLWANIKNSTFLYPSEEDYVGSTRVYSALYQKLNKSSIFGVCWFISRRNAVPVMAALVPTFAALESEDRPPNPAGASATGAPQGLHLIPLPYADDIRQNPPSFHDEPVRAPDALVEAMRPIIQQLNLPKGTYDPTRYPNPSLQWHYRILQALALDEDLPEQAEDKTLPKYKQIDRRIGNEAVTWGNELEAAYKAFLADNPDAAHVGSKRAATISGRAGLGHAGGQPEEKRAKTNVGEEIVSEEEMRELWKRGKINTLVVGQLKDFCMVKKLSVGGKKAALVERIEQWFEGSLLR